MSNQALIRRIKELSNPLDPEPTELSPSLATLPQIRCVTFDFYGTMFISGVGDIGMDEEQTEESVSLFEEALIDTGFDIKEGAGAAGIDLFNRGIQKYQSTHRERGIDHPEPDIVHIWFEVLSGLKKDGLIKGDLDRETSNRFAVEYEFRFNEIWPMPGLMPTLEKLSQKRFLLGIISNSQFYTPLAFESLTGSSLKDAGFDEDILVWSYQASVKKPSAELYKRFVKAFNNKYHMKPEQVLFVGNDMLKDIKPASEQGMKTALFAGDKRSLKLRKGHPQCRDVQPDIVITGLQQLLECLTEPIQA